MIVISHRTSVIASVDKLLVLKDGSLELYGPKEEVLKKMNERVAALRQQTQRPTPITTPIKTI